MMPSKPATTTLVKANKQLARRVKQSVTHPWQFPIHLLPSISPGQLQRLLSTVSLTGPASHPRLDEPGFVGGRFWPAERARPVDDGGSGRSPSVSDGESSGCRDGTAREAESTRHAWMRQRDSRDYYSPDLPFFPMPAMRPVPLNTPPTPLSLVVRPPSRSTSPTPEPPRKSADTLPSLAVSPSATVPEVQPITVKQAKNIAASQTLDDMASNATPPSPPLTEDGSNEDEAIINTGRFMFHVGWSGLPKQRPSDHTPSPTPLPNPFTPAKLTSTCVGEDAFFQLPYALGIADGVGGWSRKGDVRADPRRWGGLLMHFCSEEIGDWAAAKGDYAESVASSTSGSTSTTKSDERKDADWKRSLSGWNEETSSKPPGKRTTADPTLMMQKGYEKCLACFTAEGSRGSSTCLLAVLQDDSLHVANLGDCSLFIIRNGEIVHQTTEMQHAFNWPMQLGTKQKDTPMKDAMEDTWKVEKHDVVVMGSDGLTDNLCVDTITDILAGFAPPTDDVNGRPPTPPDTEALPAFCPQKLSEALCHRAQEISEELGAETPFMHKAIDNGINFVGGKRDDITVLVGLIGERK